MAIINTYLAYMDLRMINGSQYGYAYWIGYTDMPPYGGGKGTKQYGWVTGCSSAFTNWNAGQPDNGNNKEDYAVVHPSGKWLDYAPLDNFPCGCEYNPASQGSGSVSE